MNINEIIKKYDLFIFDVDGTIVNSNQIHEKAWKEALNSFNIKYKADFYNEIMGIPSLKVATMFLGPGKGAEELCKLKQSIYIKKARDIEVFQEVKSIIDMLLSSKDKHISLCTGGSRNSTELLINKLHLKDIIKYYICGDDNCPPKPSPESYKRILNFYSVKRERCIVFEDSDNGIQSALSAKLSVFRVDNGKIIDFIGN